MKPPVRGTDLVRKTPGGPVRILLRCGMHPQRRLPPFDPREAIAGVAFSDSGATNFGVDVTGSMQSRGTGPK